MEIDIMKREGKKDQNQKGKSEDRLAPRPIPVDDMFILDIWNLIDSHPVLKDLPKPTVDFCVEFMKHQPMLRQIPLIEAREHYMNILVMAYLRDKGFVQLAKVMEEYPDDWMEKIEPKWLRIIPKFIEQQEEILPRLFAETHRGGDERDARKKIMKKVGDMQVEVEKRKGGKPVDIEKDGKEEETEAPDRERG